MNLINTKDTMVRIIDYKTVKTELGKEFNLLVVKESVETALRSLLASAFSTDTNL